MKHGDHGGHGMEALLYDFGNVLIRIDFDWVFARWAELAGLPVERIKSRFRHGEEYQAHERGELGTAAFYQSLRRDLGVALSDAQLEDGWQRVFGPEHPEVVALVRDLQGRIPQYLFSNTNVEHYALWSKRYAAALAPLDGVFTSCAIGARKPERAAFDHVARAIGVPPARILFFDDTEANIEGALAAGLQAVRVRSPEDVADAVRPWL